MRDIVYTVRRLVGRHQGSLPVVISCPTAATSSPTTFPSGPAPGCRPSADSRRTPTASPARSRAGSPRRCSTCSQRRRPSCSPTSTAPTSTPTARRAARSRTRAPSRSTTSTTTRSGSSWTRSAGTTAGAGCSSTFTGPTASRRTPPISTWARSTGTRSGRCRPSTRPPSPGSAASRTLLGREGYALSARSPETLRGGFTLEAYGSANPDGLDAIQFEIHTSLRTDETRSATFIEDLAFAMSHLVARYADTGAMAAFRGANFVPRLPR